MEALVMQVKGFQFQGKIYIALDEGSDYYQCYIAETLTVNRKIYGTLSLYDMLAQYCGVSGFSFCVFGVVCFAFLWYFTLCFCGNLLCSFAVNSILISVFKTLLSGKTFSYGFRIEVCLWHTSCALNR